MAVAPRSNASHDQNFVPTMIGVSTLDGTTPVPVEVDPTNGQLQVSSSGGGGGGGASTIADGADVTQGAIADAAVTAGATGTIAAKLRAISRDIVANIVLAAGSNIIGKVGIDQTTPGTTNLVSATQSGTWTVQPGNTANTTAWLTKLVGKSVSSQTALTTTATVSGAAGTYVGGSYINLNSVPSYIQVFDTTGAVTLGTTVPTFVQPVPANATAANGAAFVFDVPGGIAITNGIKIAATTTATGASTSATALIGYTIYT